MTLQRFFSILLISTSLMFSSAAIAAEEESVTVTTVADLGTSGMCLATLCPSSDVAISAGDAEVFSIYVDVSTAIFSQLRTRGGMYVVKSGQPVVIKTAEAKAVALQSSKSPSSVIWNDLVSPVSDTSIADFMVERMIGEGQYIYMLTNMPHNGGFGLTYFTGDTLRSGKLFIVCSRVPEYAGILSTARVASTDATLYNLQGQRVVTPVPGQLYIRGGRKFVYRDSQGSKLSVNSVRTRADVVFEDGDRVPFLSGESSNDDGF